MKRICPSCQNDVDVAGDGVCPVCAWRFDTKATPSQPIRIQPAARPKVLPKVVLAVAADRTGSTYAFADGIRIMFPLILKPIEAKAQELRLWVQTHGDRDEGMEEILLTEGESADKAIADIERIVFDGGGDPPEHHLDAIEVLMNRVPWSANPMDSRGAILAILTADTKPAQSGHSPTEIGEEIKKRGLLLYVVGERTPALDELVKAADGLFLQISNSPAKEEMEIIARQLAASIILSASGSATRPL